MTYIINDIVLLFSKKSASLKHKELLEGVINPLLVLIANNPSKWLNNSSVGMVTLAILKAASISGNWCDFCWLFHVPITDVFYFSGKFECFFSLILGYLKASEKIKWESNSLF